MGGWDELTVGVAEFFVDWVVEILGTVRIRPGRRTQKDWWMLRDWETAWVVDVVFNVDHLKEKKELISDVYCW